MTDSPRETIDYVAAEAEYRKNMADAVFWTFVAGGATEFSAVVYKRPFSVPQDAAETAQREQMFTEKKAALQTEGRSMTQFNAELADMQEWVQEPNPVHSVLDPLTGLFFGGQLVLAGYLTSKAIRNKFTPR